jgi:DNA-binding winged helix-turn-helix (wHTH) protein
VSIRAQRCGLLSLAWVIEKEAGERRAPLAPPGDVVTRDELRTRIWGTSTHVDFDRAINKAITHLRRVLDDEASRPRFIETLPKRGYRFVADVTRLASRRLIKDDAKEAYLKASISGTSERRTTSSAASSTFITRSGAIRTIRSRGRASRTRTR